MRPRIRTVKPEVWQDEKVGDLSHGARLLFIGLITMADDEGRLRELPATILGHVFPYDSVSTAKLSRWLGEIGRSGMIVRYEHGGKRYIAFPHWADHQKVDRPNESDLPAPPVFDDSSPNGSPNGRRSHSDSFDDRSRPPRAGADPIRSDPIRSQGLGESKQGGRKRVDQSQPPDGFPPERVATLIAALGLLHEAWELRGGVEPQPRGVGLAMLRNERADHLGVARKLVHWLTAGRGQRAKCGDIAARFGDWVADEPAAARPGGQVLSFGSGRQSPSDMIRRIRESEAAS